MHCDLKPENLLLQSKTQDRIKIIDLGLSQIIGQHTRLKKERGSIYYLAPEMIKQNYDHKVDIWSAGVIFYILVTGKPPFDSSVKAPNGTRVLDLEKIKKKILDGNVDYTRKEFVSVNPWVIEIIQKMLTYDPDQRPNAKEILQHPYFRSKINPKVREKGIILNINYFNVYYPLKNC